VTRGGHLTGRLWAYSTSWKTGTLACPTGTVPGLCAITAGSGRPAIARDALRSSASGIPDGSGKYLQE